MAKPLWPALLEEPIRIDVPADAPWKKGQEFVLAQLDDQSGGAPAMTQRVIPIATSRQSTATHHFAGCIGSHAGSTSPRGPVIIGLTRLLPRRPDRR